MADVRVGGAYVDIYVQGLDKFNKQISDASSKLKELSEKIKQIEAQKKELSRQMQEAASAYGENSQQVESLKNRINELNNEEEKLKKSFKLTSEELDKNIKNFNELGNETDKVESKFKTLSSAATILKGVLVALSARKLWDFLIEPNIELEQYITQFTTLLGSLENAESIFEDITQKAAKTPFETSDIADTVQILSQFGVAQSELLPMFDKLANLAQGNADKLNSIALAYGKIRASGKVTLEQLNVLTERGVPILQALSDTLEITTGEVYKLISQSKLGVEDIDKAIEHLAGNGGKFFGLVDKQAETMSGKISTLKDNIALIGRDIGTETFEALSGYLSEIISEIDRMTESGELEAFTKELGQDIAAIVKGLVEALKWIIANRDEVIQLGAEILIMKTSWDAAKSAGLAFGGEVGAAIGALSFTIGATIVTVNNIANAFDELGEKIDDVAFGGLNKIKSEIDAINDGFSDALSNASKANIDLSNAFTNLESLSSYSEKTDEQIEKMKELVKVINDAYGLDLQVDKFGNLNFDIDSIREYYDYTNKILQLQTSEEAYNKLLEQKDALEANRFELERLYETYHNASLKESDAIISLAYAKTASQIQEALKANAEAQEENNASIERYKEIIESLQDVDVDFDTSSLIKVKETFGTISASIEEATSDAKELGDAMLDASSDFAKAANEQIGAVDDLSDAISKNTSEKSFNVDEALKLIQQYPQLANAIYMTTDGYKFETSALETLRTLKIQAAKDAINQQINETNATIGEIKARIRMYEREGASLKELNELRTQLELTESQQRKNRAIADSYNKMLEIASSDVGRTTATTSKRTTATTSKRTTTKAGETADEKQIRDLKFQYDMGLINAKQYYDSLEKIKDKYYADGSKKWQQYTLEITKGRKTIEEEQKKAAELEFQANIEGMRNNIEDNEYYDKLTTEQKIKNLEEIRTYILNSYLDRKIDYENFAKELRQIDKDIYKEEKTLLQDNINEMNSLRDKKYKKAVEQINKYYESIAEAQKTAEREEELKELRETEQLYEGAVSRQGQEKLKDLQKDIKKLEQQKISDELENQRMFQLENLDARYEALEESQNSYFDAVQLGAKTTAEIVSEYTNQINEFFSQIGTILSTTRELSGTKQQTINITNNNNSATAAKASYDITSIISRYGFK